MGSLSKAMEEEIRKLHPKLTDEEFQEYLRLIYSYESLLQDGSKEEAARVRERIDEFVRTNLPRLEEARANFNKKSETLRIQSMLSSLPSPVDIALANEKVADWIRERTLRVGAYTVDSQLIREPDVYLVEFRFNDSSTLRAEVERMGNNVRVIFQRTVLR